MPLPRQLRALLPGVTFGIAAGAGWILGASGPVGALLGIGLAGLGFLVGRLRRRRRRRGSRSTASFSPSPASVSRSPSAGPDAASGDPEPRGLAAPSAEPGGGGVAHDLNNVLTTINGYADLLMASLPAGHPAVDDAMQIRLAAMEGAELTNRLLSHDGRAGPEPRVRRGPPDPTGPETGSPGGARNRAGWGSGRTVLVVEDDDTLLRLAERILSLRGYHVLTATNGQAALDLVERLAPSLDLVLCDVVLPGLSGPETVDLLRAGGARFRLLYMSGYSPGHLGPYGVLQGDVDLLAKPFDPEVLVERVKEVLEAPDPTVRGAAGKG